MTIINNIFIFFAHISELTSIFDKTIMYKIKSFDNTRLHAPLFISLFVAIKGWILQSIVLNFSFRFLKKNIFRFNLKIYTYKNNDFLPAHAASVLRNDYTLFTFRANFGGIK